MKQKYLECGKIVATHGVMGAVKLESYCNSPAQLAKLKRMYTLTSSGEYKEYTVKSSSVQKTMVITTFDGFEKVEDAIPMKGKIMYADREDFRLRKDEYFVVDLIGLRVIDADSEEVYGTLDEVITPSGREIYIVREADGHTFMIPVVEEFVKKIDIDGGRILVKLIEGMREV